jgi:hypothetical protein
MTIRRIKTGGTIVMRLRKLRSFGMPNRIPQGAIGSKCWLR